MVVKNESKDNTNQLKIKTKDRDMPVKPDVEVLNEINDDSFTSKQFSSGKKVLDNIVIDLKKQTIKVPEVEPVEPEGIYHQNVSIFCIIYVTLAKRHQEVC